MPRGTVLPLAVLLATASTPALADDAVDVSRYKDKLLVMSDGKSHLLAVIPFTISDSDENGYLFYSADAGKTFYAQRRTGGGRNGDEAWDSVFWEPRVRERWKGGFGFREGKYSVQCGDRQTFFQPLAKDAAARLVAAAAWKKPRWTRQAYALARDTSGTYYYVDRARGDESSKDFRVFRGPKGDLKPLKMVNIVSDSEGDIFVTKTGKLKLVLDKHETSWSVGRDTTKLTLLELDDNIMMIYGELGVYAGQPLGTPCDDL
jgi:hypothetical protein